MYTTIDAMTAPAVEILRFPAGLTGPTVSASLAEPFVSIKGFSAMGTGSMLALAGLDLAGAYCAMRYLHTGHQIWWSVGAISYVFLFGVYAASLRWAELGTVTLGWIVFLQVGVLVMDRMANGTVLPVGKWVAVTAILGLMAYVLLAPNPRAHPPKHLPGRPSSAGGVVPVGTRGVIPVGTGGVVPVGAAGSVQADWTPVR
jgi:hypothetical protein